MSLSVFLVTAVSSLFRHLSLLFPNLLSFFFLFGVLSALSIPCAFNFLFIGCFASVLYFIFSGIVYPSLLFSSVFIYTFPVYVFIIFDWKQGWLHRGGVLLLIIF